MSAFTFVEKKPSHDNARLGERRKTMRAIFRQRGYVSEYRGCCENHSTRVTL